ncbi:MAG: 50S ribosomal protein L18 [Candidatus Auribacterota bacterium]|jgi:large subunit ribosomal protein L18|nr:50S ribosomal protein L18 [Candidatus Auribacterota bacterium]
MAKVKSRKEARKKRQVRLRKKLLGTVECPRLSVFKSLKHLYVQLIDDNNGKTLLAVSTLSKEYSSKYNETGCNIPVAKNVGALLSEKAKASKISELRFDRSGYKYHGVVKALADSIREGGITL